MKLRMNIIVWKSVQEASVLEAERYRRDKALFDFAIQG